MYFPVNIYTYSILQHCHILPQEGMPSYGAEHRYLLKKRKVTKVSITRLKQSLLCLYD